MHDEQQRNSLREAVELGPGVSAPVEAQGLAAPLAKTGAMFAALLLVHGLVDLFSGVWPIFKHLAGIPLEQAGLIATVAPLFSWTLQPVFGLWADRGHMRTCILAGLLLTFPMMFLGPMGNAGGTYTTLSYAVMFLFVFLSRMGQALFHPAAAAVAGDLAQGSGRSGMVALFVSTGWIGYSLNQWIFTYAYDNWSQHTELLLLPGVLLLGWAWLVCRPREHNAAHTHSLRDAWEGLLEARRGIIPVFLTVSCMSAVEQGVTFLLPEFAEARHCPPWAVNGGALLCFVAGTVTFMIPAGFLADRIGRKFVLLGTIALCIVFFVPMVLIEGLTWPAFLALLFLSGGMLNATGPLGVSTAQHLVSHHKSLITGIMMGLTWTVGGVSPVIVGYIVPVHGIPAGLLSLVIFNTLALFCALFIPRHQPH